MKKKIIELKRFTDIPKGYGLLGGHPEKIDALDAMLEFMTDDMSLIDYCVLSRWEEKAEYDIHRVVLDDVPYMEIPKGDLIFEVHVFYETR
jgi:hypothetical protein